MTTTKEEKDNIDHVSINKFIKQKKAKSITVIAGGQYELRIKPEGSVIHNFDGGTWQPLDGDNYIEIHYNSYDRAAPNGMSIIDKETLDVMYYLYRPQIIVSFI